MPISRSEGYRRGAGKEKAALAVFEDFMASKLEITDAVFITDKDTNWQFGDYRLPNDKFIEVKGQPVNPDKYANNFIELGEITNKDHHRDGFSMLESLLKLPDLSSKTVHNKATGTKAAIGKPECFSFSLHSLMNGTTYAYVNSYLDIVYLYSAKHLTDLIVKSIKGDRPLMRGAGNSNGDTIGVLVDLPAAIWKKINGVWTYQGKNDESAVLRSLNA